MSDQAAGGGTPAPAPEADENKLTQAEKDKIAQWFNRFSSTATCPICATRNWAALDHFIVPVAVGGPKRNSMLLGGPAYTSFMLACQTCGNVQYINAFRAEVLTAQKEESDK